MSFLLSQHIIDLLTFWEVYPLLQQLEDFGSKHKKGIQSLN
jgi:hypothetical protein